MDAQRAVAASGLKQIPRAIALELLLVTTKETYEAHVYISKLAERSGWGERVVWSALKEIERTGLIQRIRTGAASVYRWSREAIARLVRPSVV